MDKRLRLIDMVLRVLVMGEVDREAKPLEARNRRLELAIDSSHLQGWCSVPPHPKQATPQAAFPIVPLF